MADTTVIAARIRRRSSAALQVAVPVLATLLLLAGCAQEGNATAALQVGQLDVTDLELLALGADGVALSATVTNDSGVDRAFTVRWDDDGATREKSQLVPALKTVVIGPADSFIITGHAATVGSTVEVTVVQGFFSQKNDSSRDITLTVTGADLP